MKNSLTNKRKIHIYKGNILTINSNDDVFNYLVEKNGHIVFVGNELPSEYQNMKIIDLGNKCLIPTFVDTHQHFASFSLFNAGLNVMEATSNKEILEMISNYYKKCKDKTLIAFGASPYSVKEGRLVNKHELDSVCPDKPLFIVKYDGHACVVNSVLLNKVKNQAKHLRGYHEETGEMNQEAFFAFSNYITRSVNILTLIKNMKKAIDYEISKGIGMVHTVSGVGFPFDLDVTIENEFSKFLKSGFQLRVFPQSMNIETSIRRKIPRIGGCFKCALDGCFGSKDAALIDPYQNSKNNYGVLYYTDEQVIDFCKKANERGLQIEMHAIGDAAFNQAAKALKIALDDCPRNNHRHGIIHSCLPTKQGMGICKEYNIQIPMQISFDNWRQEPAEYIEGILGRRRNNMLNPIRSFYDNGCIVSFGSDAPCTSPNPLVWLYKACNHSNPKESITIKEALRCATYNGYYTTFDEDKRGSLEVGKIADMVILSDNPYSMKKEDLLKLKVEKTILNGKERYKNKMIRS